MAEIAHLETMRPLRQHKGAWLVTAAVAGHSPRWFVNRETGWTYWACSCGHYTPPCADWKQADLLIESHLDRVADGGPA